MKVVVADDEKRVCDLICALIEWDTLSLMNVGTAYDGLQALEVIKREKPDLVITDIRMPGLDGLELISRAKAVQPDLQFIIISGHKQFDYAQSAITYGVAEYLLKPIKKQELNQTLLRMRKAYEERASSQALRDKAKEDREYLKRTSFASFLKNMDFQLLAPWMQANLSMRIGIIGIQSPSKNSVLHLLESKIRMLIERDTLDVCVQQFRGDIYLLWIYPEKQRALIRNQGEALVELLKVQAQIFQDLRGTVALGIEATRLAELPRSLNSAKQVLSRRLVDGHLRLYEATGIEGADIAPFLEFVATSFQKCCAQNTQDVHSFCVVLFDRLEKNKISVHDTLAVLLQSYEQAEKCIKQQGEAVNPNGLGADTIREAETIVLAKQAYCAALQLLLERYREAREVMLSKPIRIAQTYLQSHYKDEMISLDTVSEIVHLNSSYFSALFKKNVGKGFSEYLLGLRIKEAKRLLVETNNGIAEIALEVGYHDPKHFTRLFKKTCQIKPNEYRKLYG